MSQCSARNTGRNLPPLMSDRIISSADSGAQSSRVYRPFTTETQTPSKEQTSNMKTKKIQQYNLSPRDFVKVASGEDIVQHIKNYHLENAYVPNLDKPTVN